MVTNKQLMDKLNEIDKKLERSYLESLYFILFMFTVATLGIYYQTNGSYYLYAALVFYTAGLIIFLYSSLKRK